MKKHIINLAIASMVMLNASIALAAGNARECMQNLPEVISFTHVTDPMRKTPNSWTDYEAEPNGKGLGYSQVYNNKICYVTAFLYDLNLKNITAADIQNQQAISEQQMLKSISPTDETVEQVYVTYVDNYFLKLRTTCTKLYTGDEAKYNEMTARVTSSTVEEHVTNSLTNCLK